MPDSGRRNARRDRVALYHRSDETDSVDEKRARREVARDASSGGRGARPFFMLPVFGTANSEPVEALREHQRAL
jgi:hypothetical protein